MFMYVLVVGVRVHPNNRSYFIRCVLLWFEFMYASSIRIRVALSFCYLADPNGICWISHQEKWNGSLNKKNVLRYGHVKKRNGTEQICIQPGQFTKHSAS